MKVSDVLQLALETVYQDGDLKHSFMCLALRTMAQVGQIDHQTYVDARHAVNELIHSMLPNSVCLGAALRMKGVLANNSTYEEDLVACKELYIWWVFDLKRKGL